jgi:arabinose-5-phosphate isomerase
MLWDTDPPPGSQAGRRPHPPAGSPNATLPSPTRSGKLPLVSHLARARKVFDLEMAGLRAVRRQLDDAFDRAVETIVDTLRQRGKIIVAGIGKSGNIGHKIAATLTSTGAPSVVLNSVDALHGDLGIVSDGDVVLALSYSGESEELVNLLPALRRFSIRLISFTGNLRSTLARYSDVVLNVRVPREACPFNLAPTTSTTAMLVLGDALAMAILHARGFKQSDYARLHPAGAIGRAMLLRVADIMRTGDRHAVAPETLPVRDGLLLMTRAKSGCLSIVNARGKLVGVFTDGDFRRRIPQDDHLLTRPLREVMTRNPVCIRLDALAAEALKVFNERNIDDLVVINAKGEPVGLVDSQDLPKLKLM